MFVMMSVLPKLHEEQSDGSCNNETDDWEIVSVLRRNVTEDDEHKGEVVPGLGVAAMDVDVASEGSTHQQRNTADALHKTPAPREVFCSNPANKEIQESLKLCFLLLTFER